jgi:hypothetical protein
VVTDTGSFSEFPDDVVIKVTLEREKEKLAAAVNKLALDSDFRAQLGARAKRFAFDRNRAEHYASRFLEFLRECHGALPILKLADHVAEEFNAFGVTPETPLVDTVSSEISTLFGAA